METKKLELDDLMSLYQRKNQEFQELLNETIQINKKIHKKKKQTISTIQIKEKQKFDNRLENVLLEISQTLPPQKKEEGIIEKLRKSFLLGSNHRLSNSNTSQDKADPRSQYYKTDKAPIYSGRASGNYLRRKFDTKGSSKRFMEDQQLPQFGKAYGTDKVTISKTRPLAQKEKNEKEERHNSRISDLDISDLSEGSRILRDYQKKMRGKKKKMSRESGQIFIREGSDIEPRKMTDELDSDDLDKRLDDMENHHTILQKQREKREQDRLLQDSDDLSSGNSGDATIKLMNLSQINRDSNSSLSLSMPFESRKVGNYG